MNATESLRPGIQRLLAESRGRMPRAVAARERRDEREEGFFVELVPDPAERPAVPRVRDDASPAWPARSRRRCHIVRSHPGLTMRATSMPDR